MPKTQTQAEIEDLEDQMPPDDGGGTDAQMGITEIMNLPEVQAVISSQVRAQVSELSKEIIAQLRSEMTPDKPPMVMTPKIGDQFTGSNAPGSNALVPLRHYRCDRFVAMKVPEWDMDLFERYKSDPDLVPKDPKTGLPKPIKMLVAKKGKWLSIIDTHLYVYTDNQVKQIEYMRTLPKNQGGLPDVYEDTGAQIQECLVCQPKKQFADKKTWAAHMVATHNELAYAALAGLAAA